MLIVNNPTGLKHEMPEGHPERIARLETVFAVLSDVPATRAEAPLADESDLLLGHPKDYVDTIRSAMPKEGMAMIDADTSASPGTWEAALRGRWWLPFGRGSGSFGQTQARLCRHSSSGPPR